MKTTFRYQFTAGLFSLILLGTACDHRNNDTLDPTDNSSTGQNYPGVGTDGDGSSSRMADTNRVDDGSVDAVRGESNNPNLP